MPDIEPWSSISSSMCLDFVKVYGLG
jgi:hypothetical protein